MTNRLLVVLGKNIGIRQGRKEIIQDEYNLSLESRFNVIAAGSLWQPDTDILFSSGHTAGADLPSEAAAMERYLKDKYKIPDKNIFLEEDSLDTVGNAEKTAEFLKKHAYEQVCLISVGYHLPNAAKLFRRYGIELNEIFRSEDIVRTSKSEYSGVIKTWRKSPRVRAERLKEKLRAMILFFDRKGYFLRKVMERVRS